MNYPRTISVRLSGEVSTKSQATRKRFHRRLISNMRDALRREQIEHSVTDSWYRLDVETDDLRAADVLSRIFGIRAVAVSTKVPYTEMQELVDFGAEFFAEKVKDKVFAVRVRRAGDREHMKFESPDLERALGTQLLEFSRGVNLKNPDVFAHIEVRKDFALFQETEIEGPSGLPTGVEGRALSLISGGFDSAVSSWMMMKRGVDLDYVFFNLGGPEPLRHALRSAKRLVDRWAYGHSPRLHVIDIRPLVAEMKREVPQKLWQIMLKRFMYRGAEQLVGLIGKGEGVLVTGEAIGQVSSQTLSNLDTIARAIEATVFRPLIATNKQDIIAQALKIGTHKPSESVPEFCDLAGSRVSTESLAEELEKHETKTMAAMLTEVVEQRRVWSLFKTDPTDVILDVSIDTAPEGAITLDLREPNRREREPIADAVAIDFDTALEQAKLLPKSGTYVVVCELGLKSSYLAELMQRMGFDAYVLKASLK